MYIQIFATKHLKLRCYNSPCYTLNLKQKHHKKDKQKIIHKKQVARNGAQKEQKKIIMHTRETVNFSPLE